MRITFLGTGAGEMYPGVWCRCPNCEKARRLGGKNIRRFSALYIEPNYLIDLGPTIVSSALDCGVDLTKIKHLLITHSHGDHFVPGWLRYRYLEDPKYIGNPPLDVAGPRLGDLETMNVYGSRLVCITIEKIIPPNMMEKCAIKLHQLQPFNEYEVGDFIVTPVKANHGKSGEALNFIMQNGATTIFYGLDTGWFLPETYKAIATKKYDLVVLEGTMGLGLPGGHFNFESLRKAHELFCKDGLLKKGAYFVTSHISHNHTAIHDEVAPILAKESIIVAYDGMSIDV